MEQRWGTTDSRSLLLFPCLFQQGDSFKTCGRHSGKDFATAVKIEVETVVTQIIRNPKTYRASRIVTCFASQ